MSDTPTAATPPNLPAGYFPVWIVECRKGVPQILKTHARPRAGKWGGHTYIDHHGSRMAWHGAPGKMQQAPVHPYGIVGMCLTEEDAGRMLDDYREAARAYHLEQAAKLSLVPASTPLALEPHTLRWVEIEGADPAKIKRMAGIEVLGYHPSWVCADFNPNGYRVCVAFDYDDEHGWYIWKTARYCPDQDTWCDSIEFPSHCAMLSPFSHHSAHLNP